ncbi:hypothetical protein [Haloarcula onubensis]|uniref:CARDB domain-containing protein n=1 Tax=Haloarcula onubensis TaxID=2950539 RepID=A0ABU2FQN7_9EURY|nr:hypothetical protein [Halomicroarcula sp. S3CR25-11]MDS0283063.1 hypothetical protein [Halomicroarcula sp. S3CR25-11]
MRRRHLLALVGSLVAGSGCTGTSGEPTADGTVTPAPVPSPSDAPTTPDSTGDVEITAAAVQPGIVQPRIDSIGVTDDAGQYLVVDVAGNAPDRSDIELRFSGASYLPEELRRPLYRGDFSGETYGEDGGPLVFGLPETGDATDAELYWGEGRWAPSAETVERLEDPLPPFSVTLDGPETAGAGSNPQVTITVTNEGEGAGRYVLALNRQGPRVAYTPVGRLAGELDPGASKRHTVDAVPPDGDRSTQYTLDVPGRQDRLRHVISSADGDDA